MGAPAVPLLHRVGLALLPPAALLFALNSKSTMYEMVQNLQGDAGSCIVPLAAGIYWKRANIGRGVLGGLGACFLDPRGWGHYARCADSAVLVGLAFSLIGMVLGSFAHKSG